MVSARLCVPQLHDGGGMRAPDQPGEAHHGEVFRRGQRHGQKRRQQVGRKDISVRHCSDVLLLAALRGMQILRSQK
jgi:hypothetical protein